MCMDFGEGQNPVNWPIKPLSVSLRAKGHVEGTNTATLGISAAFFMKREVGAWEI